MNRVLITVSYLIASIAAGAVLPRIEFIYFPQLLHGMSAASAQALLSATASGMMALTGIAFSLIFLIVQFSGSAYSPRLVSTFARDPLLFHALGAFIATFVYALCTLAWIDRDKNGYVPFFSTYLVVALLIGAMGLLLRLVLRVRELTITNVLREIADKGRAAIALWPLAGNRTPRDGSVRADTSLARNVQAICYRGTPKAVIDIDLNALVRIAEDANATISVDCAIGDVLVEGLTAFRIYDAKAPVSDAALMRTLKLAYERSIARDPKYALRLLVDIAIKALSPGINDPTTAVQALDQIEDLLLRLMRRELDTGVGRDRNGVVRATFPCASWADYLALSFDEIRLCSTSQLQVLRRLRAALIALASAASGARAETVRDYVRHLDGMLAAAPLDTVDRASAQQEDRQGLGATRLR